MKVILNKDISPLGEEGDVKDVAKGYARNFLFPRGFALPYNDSVVKLFEGRRAEIEARKAEKRAAALSVKEKIEAATLTIVMPAGINGKLYGAVTNQTIFDELNKLGFQVERKRIELPGNSIKNTGKYSVAVKLYESAAAALTVIVEAQIVKTEQKESSAKPPRRRHNERVGAGAATEEQKDAEPVPAAESSAPAAEPVAAVEPAAAAEPVTEA